MYSVFFFQQIHECETSISYAVLWLDVYINNFNLLTRRRVDKNGRLDIPRSFQRLESPAAIRRSSRGNWTTGHFVHESNFQGDNRFSVRKGIFRARDRTSTKTNMMYCWAFSLHSVRLGKQFAAFLIMKKRPFFFIFHPRHAMVHCLSSAKGRTKARYVAETRISLCAWNTWGKLPGFPSNFRQSSAFESSIDSAKVR